MEMVTNGSGTIFAVFRFRQSNNSELRVYNSATVLQTNQWYHVVIRYDGSPYSGGTQIPSSAVTIYVTPDSANVLNTPGMGTLATGLAASSDTGHDRPMLIGASYIGNGRWGGPQEPFYGYIDEVMIYKRALTTAEIEVLFQRDR